MINCFLKFNKLLKNDEIRLASSKTNNILHDYSFHHIFEEFDFDKNQIIYQNFMGSPIIVINNFTVNDYNPNDRYFIISFKKTLLIINQSQVIFLHSLFSKNPNLKFCFLSECQTIFVQNYKTQINQIICNEIFFEKEISNFESRIHINKSSKKLFSKREFNSIMGSIAGYLIKQSYSKLNEKRDFYFQTNKKPEEIIFNENDFIDLRDIGSGSTFYAQLMYHIEKEELFVVKSAKNDSTKLVEREINNYRRINYPLIPKYYGTIKGKNCIIIEFINGQTLSKIKEMNLSEDDKYTIYFQLLIIFNYIQKNRFIYRDLKPDNVIIDDKKRVFLIDFDRMIENSEEASTTDFSSEFVSPDVNGGIVSYGSDIYSLLIMLFYICNEKVPDQQYIENVKSNIDSFLISEIIKIYYTQNYLHINIDISIIQNDSDLLFLLGETNRVEIQNIEKSIYFYSLAANKNMPQAQFNLGLIYFENKYIKRDINKSIYYFSLAANNNIPEAQYNLSIIYYENKYIERDINKSIYYLTLAANQNHSNAQFNLGLFYYEGQYIKRDIDKSIYYYSLAAKQNHSQAQCNLGLIYYEGEYIKRDINKSIYYYTLAAKQNHTQAQYNLGIIYIEGKYIARDVYKSIHYLTLAANQNNPLAQYNLGFIYVDGKYIKRDIKKSIYYFTLAANHNILQAYNSLGLIYYENKYIKRDINKSIYYFTLAANLNHPRSQYNLGFIYYENKYIKRDINKSIYYFTLAANQNHPKAQFHLGIIYYLGLHNTPINIKKGQYYIILSSKNEDKQGNFSHGFLLHEGKNIERNIKEAIHYYKEASSFNNEYAKNNLGIIYKNGFGDEIEEKIGYAIEYFDEAIRQKNDYLSMYNLSHIYIYNESIKLQDINKPIELLIKSSNKLKYSLFLLCLILIKRFGCEFKTFEQEVDKLIDAKSGKKSEIFQLIYSFNLFDKSKFNFYYESFKKIDFLYDIGLNPIFSSCLNHIKTNLNLLKYPNAKNISSEFYESFGNDLLV